MGLKKFIHWESRGYKYNELEEKKHRKKVALKKGEGNPGEEK